ncbi:FAD-dependent thymidylate synthase [Cumulibacter manganitolerans]|uniref:FAD-dependent thymidylate synthase n=1 Tax=Cumulibacter manganitolerans TaxID=1884992 RepID=UPI00129807C6|nr:FAD-dependent thymidylate synthase [Cumulibacter manganitolerans]
MSDQTTLRVDVIATTRFSAPADVPWSTDADGGQALAEFAGRACYRSWDKPKAATATNAGYLRHVIEVGHLSVLEHAQVTLYIRGVSRSVTHELIRHRHLSYSQLSQRHVIDDPAFVVPQPVNGDDELGGLFERAAATARAAYDELIEGIGQRLAGSEGATRSKRARQAAQALLPAARATEIVVTGNLRAWRQLIATHGSDHADDELRELAVACLQRLREVEPNAFADFLLTDLPDGRRIASSALVTEG